MPGWKSRAGTKPDEGPCGIVRPNHPASTRTQLDARHLGLRRSGLAALARLGGQGTSQQVFRYLLLGMPGNPGLRIRQRFVVRAAKSWMLFGDQAQLVRGAGGGESAGGA